MLAVYTPKTLEELTQQAGVPLSEVQSYMQKNPDVTQEAAIGSVVAQNKKSDIGVISTDDAKNQVATDLNYLNKTIPLPIQTTDTQEPVKKTDETQKIDTSGALTLDEAYELFGEDFTGLQQTPDGKFIPDTDAYKRLGITGLSSTTSPLETDIKVLDTQITTLVNDLRSYNVDNDPAFQRQAGSIRAEYDKMRNNMTQINESRQAALKSLGFRRGSMQYAGGTFQGLIGEEVNQANERMAEITRQENAAISAARTAYENQNYTKFSQQVNALQTLRENKAEELTRYNDALIEANKNAMEQAKFDLDVAKFAQEIEKQEFEEYKFERTYGLDVDKFEQSVKEAASNLKLNQQEFAFEQDKFLTQFQLEMNQFNEGIRRFGITNALDELKLEIQQSQNAFEREIKWQTLLNNTPEGEIVTIDGREGVGRKGIETKIGQYPVGTIENAIQNAFNFAGASMTEATRESNTQTIRSLLESGQIDQAKDFLKRIALTEAPTEQQNKAFGRSESIIALRNIQELLNQYEAQGGDTGFFTGTLEKIYNKIGQTTDPDLAVIQNQIRTAIIDYRRAVSGAAFTETEAREYDRLFPSVGKVSNFNRATISSLLSTFERNDETFMRNMIGSGNYNIIFNKTIGPNQTASGAQAGTVPIMSYWNIDGLLYNFPELTNDYLKYENSGEYESREILQILNQTLFEMYNEPDFNQVGGDTDKAITKATDIKDGTKIGQCGRFVNKIAGIGVGDTYQSKIVKMDKSITKPEPGMVFVMPYKDTGHTGIILSINNDGTATVKDSNWALDEKVKTHKVAISKMTGFKRIG